jgi:argininosuccinate synthase
VPLKYPEDMKLYGPIRENSFSDLFQTAIEFLPSCGITTTIQHTNTQVTKYTQIHTSHKITPLENKQNKDKQTISQSHTNSEGHITANEYSLEKGEEIKRCLIQALEPY